MPTIPSNTKCAMLGCKNNKARFSSNCVEHGGRDTQRYSGKRLTNKMYDTAQWARLRQIQLSSQPLCAGCLADGVITAAVHVDHVFPWTQISKEAFYINIFQSLCHSCHSAKTALERKGLFRAFGSPNKDYLIHEYAQATKVALTG